MASEDGIPAAGSTPSRARAPGMLSMALSVGLATGSTGAFAGAITATLKNHPRKGVFIMGTALSTFVLGSGFYVSRELFSRRLFPGDQSLKITPSDTIFLSGTAGAFMGGVWGSIIGGRRHAIPGLLVFGLAGVGGQYLYNQAMAGKENIAIGDSKPDGRIMRYLSSQNSLIRRLSKEEYLDMLRERQLGFDADIALIDEELEKLFKQLEVDDPKAATRLREAHIRKSGNR